MELLFPEPALAALDRAARGEAKVLVLTGAGISAESGIPTFRGAEGYWKIGSRNYFPEELATRAAFEAMPDAIWAWYLYRRGVCRAAEPNAAHRALVTLEDGLRSRFLLVTQNVDGLHRRAGNTGARTLEIHGNTDFMRCQDECAPRPPAAFIPIPEGLPVAWPKERALTEKESALLRCPRCGARSRPNVLWFDEYYDEPIFRAETALLAAEEACLLLVVGTAGQTNLPRQIVARVAGRGVPILVVDREETVFFPLALESDGAGLIGPATAWVPAIVSRLLATARS